MSKKYVVDSNQAPRAIGPFSQAVGFQGLLFISGQNAVHPRTGDIVLGGVEAQARRAMENVKAVLTAAGLDMSHVLKTTVYLRNMNDFELVDDVYRGYFDHASPARTVVEVSRLRKDGLVEIDVVAAAPADYEALVEEPTPSEPAPISGDDALDDDEAAGEGAPSEEDEEKGVPD